jgi:hypothetical protein
MSPKTQSLDVGSESKETEEDRQYWAKCAYHPTWHAANAVGRLTYGETPPDMLLPLLNELGEQVRAVTRNGDLSRGQAMLTAQAHTLQSLHYHLLGKALFEGYVSSTDMELFLKVFAEGASAVSARHRNTGELEESANSGLHADKHCGKYPGEQCSVTARSTGKRAKQTFGSRRWRTAGHPLGGHHRRRTYGAGSPGSGRRGPSRRRVRHWLLAIPTRAL